MNWDWMYLWWKHFYTSDMELVFILIKNHSEIVGLFPLVKIPSKGRKILHFLGTGEDEAEEITTEYIDVIAKPGFEKRVCCLVINYLTTEYTNWDEINLSRYNQDSNIVKHLLIESDNKGIKRVEFLSGYRHFVTLNDDYHSYIEQQTRSFRKKLVSNKTKLLSKGKVEFMLVEQEKEVASILNHLKEFHLKRSKFIGRKSAFESQSFIAFHLEYMQIMANKQQLHLGVLYLDEKIISVEYNFKLGETSYAYQGSFDNDYKKLSLGFLSINLMIEESILSGFQVFDFMMNEVDSYANFYGCSQSPILSCRLFNQNIPNRYIYSLLKLKFLIKKHL